MSSQNVPNSLSNPTTPWESNSEKGRTDQTYIVVDSVRDYEGHWYKVVQIGSQCWLKENMRAKIYSDGSQLLVGNSNTSNTNRYYYEAYGNADSTKKYGYLYNWAAAVNCSNAVNNSDINFEMAQGICPTGWHVPTNGDWVTMETFLNGGTSLDYGTLNKYLGTFAGKLACGDWSVSGVSQDYTTSTPGNHNYLYRNSTGFSALPVDESQNFFGNRARFWTSTNGSTKPQTYTKISRWLFRNNQGIRYAVDAADNKFSVRCVRG
jgi:uncharacterized protein (TIGR02145 family)